MYDSPIEDNEYRIAVRVHNPEPVWTANGPRVLFDYHFMDCTADELLGMEKPQP